MCPGAHTVRLLLFEQEDGVVKELGTAMQLLRNCLYQNEDGKVSGTASPLAVAADFSVRRQDTAVSCEKVDTAAVSDAQRLFSELWSQNRCPDLVLQHR